MPATLPGTGARVVRSNEQFGWTEAANFPHTVSLEALREGIEATAQSGREHSEDYDLGIHATSGRDSDDKALGSIAVVLSPSGRKRDVWRFEDDREDAIELESARRFD